MRFNLILSLLVVALAGCSGGAVGNSTPVTPNSYTTFLEPTLSSNGVACTSDCSSYWTTPPTQIVVSPNPNGSATTFKWDTIASVNGPSGQPEYTNVYLGAQPTSGTFSGTLTLNVSGCTTGPKLGAPMGIQLYAVDSSGNQASGVMDVSFSC